MKIADVNSWMIRPLLSPLLYIWPWLIGIFIFAAFITSSQGIALAEDYSTQGYSDLSVTMVLVFTWLVTYFSSLLVLISPSINKIDNKDEGADRQKRRRYTIFFYGGWLIILSNSYGVLFADSIGSFVPWAAAGLLSVISVILAIWPVLEMPKDGSRATRWLDFFRDHHVKFAALAFILAILPLAIGALISVNRPTVLMNSGPLLISMIGLAASSSLFGVVLVAIPVALSRPWLGVAFLGVMVCARIYQSPQVDTENPLLKDLSDKTENELRKSRKKKICRMTAHNLEGSLSEHTKIDKEHPTPANSAHSDRTIYLVSAEGGGIRAAYWTALNLAQLDIATDGRFAEEVVSLSGVSGGSLGIATWLAARDRTDLDGHARLELVTKFLSSDFLSPLIGGFLFLDVPRIVMGPLWGEARRDHVFEKALVDRWSAVGETDFFARQFLGLCISGINKTPVIVFNATDSQSGQYIPLASGQLIDGVDVRSMISSLDRTSIANATVAQMVHISARFPYLSPSAPVGVNASVFASDAAFMDLDKKRDQNVMTKEEVEAAEEAIAGKSNKIAGEGLWSRVWNLVDGGYFDNTGLTPTKQALSYIEESRTKEMSRPEDRWRFLKTTVNVIHLSNDPEHLCLPLPENWHHKLSSRARHFVELSNIKLQCGYEIALLEESLRMNPFSWFTTPLDSIISVRNEHSKRAVDELKRTSLIGPSGRYSAIFINEISLRDALGRAFGHALDNGFPSKVFQFSEADSPYTAYELAMLDMVREATQAAVMDGRITSGAANAYLDKLLKWEQEVRAESKRAECHKQFLLPLTPPLGWTLSRGNRELMNCLAFRTAIEGKFSHSPMPSFLDLVNDSTASH